MDITFQSKVAIMENAVAVGSISNNIINVRSQDAESSDMIFSAVILSSKKPKNGDTGIVLLPGGDRSGAIWIGSLVDTIKASREEEEQDEKPEDISLTNDSKDAFVKLNGNTLSIGNKSTQLIGDKNTLIIQQGKGIFDLSSSHVKLKTLKSSFSLTDVGINLETPGDLNLLSGNNLNLVTKNNLIVSGGLYNSSEKDFIKSLGGINKFILKSNEAFVSIGSLLVINAGALDLNLASGKMVGGAEPGKGSKTTFKLNIAQGNINVATGSGDINIGSLLPTNKITIRVGNQPVAPSYSELVLKGTKAILEQRTGLGSSIELSTGDILAEADKDVTIKSKMNSEIKATMKLELLANLEALIQSKTILTVEGKVQVDIKAPILSLKDSNIIMAGPKVVTPSGTGPFCALPICPIIGIQHSGEMAVG